MGRTILGSFGNMTASMLASATERRRYRTSARIAADIVIAITLRRPANDEQVSCRVD